MTSRARRALAIWDAPRRRNAASAAYAAYAAVLVIVVVAVPIARAVWLALVDPSTVAFLAAESGPRAVTIVVTLCWAGLLVAGRSIGPAVLPPLLSFAMAGSDIPRPRVFARPLRRTVTIAALAATAAASACGAALVVGAVWSAPQGVVFALTGLLVGLIATALWVAGQVFPRGGVVLGVALAAAGAATLFWPASAVVVPAGWVGLVFGAAAGWAPVAGLAVLAAALLSTVPALLERLTVDAVMQQSVRREATFAHAAVLQLDQVSSLYQAKPTAGRFRRAVRIGRHPLRAFFRADLVGATRTPGRLAAAVVSVVAAGALLATAVSLQGVGGAFWGTLGGLILFAGLGPLTDGIRHAAAAVSERSIYGIGDGVLLSAHAAMPATVMTALLLLSAGVAAAVAGADVVGCALLAVSAGVIALGTRIAGALKGPMPLSLLAAVPTPFGDPMGLIRVAWAVDGLLLAAVAGAGVGLGALGPAVLLTAASAAAYAGVSRWRRRAD